MSGIGMIGSPIHILTNKNIEGFSNKIGCLNETNKESFKSIGKGMVAAAAAGGVAAGTSAVLGKVKPNTLENISNVVKDTIKNITNKVSVNGKTLTEKISSSKIYSKFKSLPTPAKAAAAAGAAVLSLAALIITHSNKSAYI